MSDTAERLIILVPALLPVAYFLGGLAVFSILCLLGRRPVTGETRKHGKYFYFLIDYFIWLLRPIERLLVTSRLSPNLLTVGSVVACAGSGLAIGTGHMATAGWLYIVGGGLDVLDGRLARATGQQSVAGGFLDSIADRWAELFVFAGFAWFLHDSLWLMAVMAAVAGSMMVSYTRAKGESMGIVLDGGAMQRAERIALVSTGTLVTAWFETSRVTADYAEHVIGVALLITGLGSAFTAVQKGWVGYRKLSEKNGAEGIARPNTSSPGRALR